MEPNVERNVSSKVEKETKGLTPSMPKHIVKKKFESNWQMEDGMWDWKSKGKKKQKRLGGINTLSPQKL